jgi:hypothetical protein
LHLVLFFFFFFFFFFSSSSSSSSFLLQDPGGYRPRNVPQPAGLFYYGGTMGEKCPVILPTVTTSTPLPQICDMGQTASLSLRRKAC